MGGSGHDACRHYMIRSYPAAGEITRHVSLVALTHDEPLCPILFDDEERVCVTRPHGPKPIQRYGY